VGMTPLRYFVACLINSKNQGPEVYAIWASCYRPEYLIGSVPPPGGEEVSLPKGRIGTKVALLTCSL
jgi:hypothetical protein